MKTIHVNFTIRYYDYQPVTSDTPNCQCGKILLDNHKCQASVEITYEKEIKATGTQVQETELGSQETFWVVNV